jgi:glucose/arabinose dehydrogenase
VNEEGVRPEIWAFGLRNPWRMSIDRATGELWVGDVGWELWEMVYKVKRGGNYGWSVMEGPQPVHVEDRRRLEETMTLCMRARRFSPAASSASDKWRSSPRG